MHPSLYKNSFINSVKQSWSVLFRVLRCSSFAWVWEPNKKFAQPARRPGVLPDCSILFASLDGKMRHGPRTYECAHTTPSVRQPGRPRYYVSSQYVDWPRARRVIAGDPVRSVARASPLTSVRPASARGRNRPGLMIDEAVSAAAHLQSDSLQPLSCGTTPDAERVPSSARAE
jgi:hypothetical protein